MAPGAKIALAVVGFLLLLGGGAASAKTVVTTSGPRRAKFSSYDGDTSTWAKRRFALAYEYFRTHWQNALSDEAAKEAALSVLAHWAIETGTGTSEYNFNVGNIHAVGAGPWFGSADQAERTGKTYGAQFAAYPSLDAGVHAYLALLENSRYAHCLDLLVESPSDPEWFKCLGEAGYFAKTMPDKKTGKPVDNLELAAKLLVQKRAALAQYAGVS